MAKKSKKTKDEESPIKKSKSSKPRVKAESKTSRTAAKPKPKAKPKETAKAKPKAAAKAKSKVSTRAKTEAKPKTTKTTRKPKAITKKEQKEIESYSLLTDFDIHLFREGQHFKLYEKLGSHVIEYKGKKGTYFAVWAPNAESVSVIGNFNHWNNEANYLTARWDSSGIWEGFIPGIDYGEAYKYTIRTPQGEVLEKGDPFARYWEEPPRTASIVWKMDYKWKDKEWMKNRMETAGEPKPYSVYEVHLGSWKMKAEGENRFLNYGELAHELADYVKDLGFTHVEFLPIMEHPFYGSWGYQITGYFAPSSRFGNPQDLMYMVDILHKAGIGVILDWVPSHFPVDEHGLARFDGTHLYEHADPRKGFHPDWKSYIFNYGRNEVKSFLISNALFWLDQYHIDGLRVDAVASMLYLDYSREEGEWIPNEHGGRENMEAIHFLQDFNINAYKEFPDIVTIAEESTSWSNVSKPVYMGGLGFGQKWMMGWMHDTLEYFKKDPIYRKYHQNEITFGIMYAFTENFMLPLSHDEVVHGKGSLIGRMPGDEWQRFANLRLLYGFMYSHPGTKILFMGGEFGQYSEWNHEKSLDWHLLDYQPHQNMLNWIRDLNSIYKDEKALYEFQFEDRGFEWIDYSDSEGSVVAFLRKGNDPDDYLVIICNFTPAPRYNYRIGVPQRGYWKEILNSDDLKYGGSGVINVGNLKSAPVRHYEREFSIAPTLPPLGITILKKEADVVDYEYVGS